MAETKERRFQSGREVFETYVPGYPSTESEDITTTGSHRAGAKLARALLAQFSQQLESAGVQRRPTTSSRRSKRRR